ncbi:MAG: 4-hydroxy-3-methylbut-2-enyl diphosphate reductase [Deltaproteobacteria bacterium]|nr:4-hydroxy-3-methylbut-2-enyl diphosphate reductase [Deltaproteobacteria bacterium]
MKVRLARKAGFCMGVRRAMELALAAANQTAGDIYTYGPLIHNPQVLALLEAKGVRRLDEIPPPGSRSGGTVIIRAHGVPREAKAGLKAAGFDRIIDGTCPRVVRVQAIIRRAARGGKDVVIVGDRAHPEVVGLLGHTAGRGHVVAQPAEVAELPALANPVAVAQTTQSGERFAAVVAALTGRFGAVEVHDTICEATHRRQDEVRRLAAEVDGVVVVGGRDSGNTRRLRQIAGEGGRPAFLVETEGELDRATLAGLGRVGVTAGASTPNWMIKKVVRELGSIRSRRESGLAHWARLILRFLVRSQLWVAAGAAGMTLASCRLQGLPLDLRLAGVAFFYIQAMHILNHFLDKEAGQFNEPDQAQFLAKHKWLLVGLGVFSTVAAITLCASLGWLPLVLVTLMSITGLLYSVPVFPPRLEHLVGIERLKDIPGSKTLSAALAWAMIGAILPAAAREAFAPLGTPLAFAYILVLVFVRCAFFDVLDVQGDLIVGKETIPIVLGEKKTRRLLGMLLGGLALVLLAAPLAGLPGPLAWGLLVPVGGLAVMQLAIHRHWVMPGHASEGLVDFNFWLAGLMAAVAG